MQTCPQCRHANHSTSAFCDACATPLAGWDLPDNVRRYERELAEYASDGVIEAWEDDELDDLGQRLKISPGRCAEIRKKYQPLSELPVLGVFIDAALFRGFLAGSTNVLQLRVLNGSGRAVRNNQVRWAVPQTGLFGEHSARIIGPNKDDIIALPLKLPDQGQYAVEVWIRTEVRPEDGEDRPMYFRSVPVTFKVAAEAGPGPKSVNVVANVDASAMRTSADSLVNVSGMTGTRDHGGLHTDSRWHDLTIVPGTEASWDLWWVHRQDERAVLVAGGSSPAGINPALRWLETLQGLSWVGARPDGGGGSICTLELVSEVSREIVLIPRAKVTFGRDLLRCDLRLAVEPYEGNERNFQASRRISGIHCELSLQENAAVFTYRGSSPSTYLGKVQVKEPVTLERAPLEMVFGRDAEFVEGVITLRMRRLARVGGDLGGVWIERCTNLPTRSYVQLCGAVPVSLRDGSMDVAPEHASAYLGVAQGHPVLINASSQSWQSSVGSVAMRQGVVLREGVEVESKGWKITVRR
jgi:hypothetical protein